MANTTTKVTEFEEDGKKVVVTESDRDTYGFYSDESNRQDALQRAIEYYGSYDNGIRSGAYDNASAEDVIEVAKKFFNFLSAKDAYPVTGE